MRIGINLLAFLPGVSGGIEFYIRNLLTALAEMDAENDYYLFTNRENHDTFQFDNPHFTRIRLNVGARPQLARIACEQLLLPVMAIKYRLEVLHSPSYTFPVLAPVPGILTICDMLYKTYPQAIGEPKLTFWRVFVPWSVRRCKRVLTISESSCQDIVHFLGISADKVIVTPLALDRRLERMQRPSPEDVEAQLTKHQLARPYVLFVGGVGRHKNAISLVEALAVLHKRPETRAVHLVITGNDYGVRQEITKATAVMGLDEFVHLPGYVARDDLPALYSGAAAYVAPSLFEGFGLTLLESMFFGAPVVTSDRSSLPEVAGDAALIVNPEDVGALADAVFRVLTDEAERARLIAQGYARVQAYSWHNTAQLTLQAYLEVATFESPVGR